MITIEDIEAFAESHEADMQAATEYARRSEKGLPADRLCDGTTGAHAVARGIDAWIKSFAMCVSMLKLIEDIERQKGEDSMALADVDTERGHKK